ncbi:unnamed protein product [Lactuca saligna]|uniref:Uncharacterized protein n=1 Tax=Lactuca saligna TaxID=75948 RepID=A0AA36A2V3_LACSI|nr:unnamed protein product [Lactuca saligna]
MVASTIFHRQECDKDPSRYLFYMWCLIQTEVELKVIHEPTFVTHQIPRHVELDFPEPTLGDVMYHLVVTWEEHRWITASLIRVMCLLGIDHTAFASADPFVPPPPQPWSTSYNGTGPSGTHPRDTDEDDNDDDDDDETETELKGGERRFVSFIFVF